MKFARRSVSDSDIRKYQAFAQTLQQVWPEGGRGAARGGEAAPTSWHHIYSVLRPTFLWPNDWPAGSPWAHVRPSGGSQC